MSKIYKKNNKLIISLFLLSVLCGCEERKTVPVEDNRNKTYSYRVEEEGVERLPFPKTVKAEEGENYTKIAETYNIPYSKLLESNKESEDRQLNLGEVVYLPQTLYHQVLHGENVEIICRKYRQYNVTREEIKDLNNLASDELEYGKIIKIFSLEEPEMKYAEIASEEKIEVQDIKEEDKKEEENYDNGKEEKLPVLTPKIAPPPSFAWPAKGNIIENKLSSETNGKNQPYGITIELDINSPVNSIADGEVIHVGSTKDYGNMIIIKHEDSVLSAYGYLSEMSVAKSSKIKQGTEIGKSGKRLLDDKPSLYLVTRKKSVMVDPLSLLPKTN